MTADTRTITVEQLAAAGFEPDQFVCARCHHHGSRHDVNDRCLDCIEQVGPDYFVSMTVDEAWDWGFAALPAEPKPLEHFVVDGVGPDGSLTGHSEDEADRLLVALVTAEYAPKDGDGDYQNYAAYGAWLDALAAARAYLARKGLA